MENYGKSNKILIDWEIFEKPLGYVDSALQHNMDLTLLSIWNCFIRFVGNGLHLTDYSCIDEWIERIVDWKEKGLQCVCFFLHQHDEMDTPILADYTLKRSMRNWDWI